MRKIIFLLPLLVFASCAKNQSVYTSDSHRVSNQHSYNDKRDDMEAAIVTAGKTEERVNFNAPMSSVFNAAFKSIEFLKWPVAFTDEHEGTIRLKEAYVYNKDGKLLRSYTWPSKADTRRSNINYYLERVARYTPGTADTIFTQENLKITFKKVSDTVTEVKIDYSIRPYTLEGVIGYEVMSNGYIESLIIEHMKENLAGKPVARN